MAPFAVRVAGSAASLVLFAVAIVSAGMFGLVIATKAIMFLRDPIPLIALGAFGSLAVASFLSARLVWRGTWMASI
jgi:hypothetical protein